METKIGSSISRALERAADSTGTLTGLITISAFGVAKLIASTTGATAFAIATFGAVGALECIHRQRKSNTEERSKIEGTASRDFMLNIIDKYPRYNVKIFKQFSHSGLQWKVIGYDEIPMPIAVTGPFCPTCGDKLTERFEVRFPARTRINLFCGCGFSQESRYFAAELSREAHKLANTTS